MLKAIKQNINRITTKLLKANEVILNAEQMWNKFYVKMIVQTTKIKIKHVKA